MHIQNLTPPRPVSLEPRALGTRASTPPIDLPEPPSWRAVRNVAAAIVVLALGGMFVGAPYKSVDRLGRALESGNAKELEALIDFAALREDLKEQVGAAMDAQAGAADGRLAVADPALTNAIIEAVFRPDVVAKLRETPVDPYTRARVRFAMKRAHLGYDDVQSFSIRVDVADVSDEPIRFRMRRSGLLSWKVTSVNLPKDLSRLQQVGESAPTIQERKLEGLARLD